MTVEIITKEDLQVFREQLLADLLQIIQRPYNSSNKKLLRSSEVRKLLKISPGTLQNLRMKGTLNPVKLSGSSIWYYDGDEIDKLLLG